MGLIDALVGLSVVGVFFYLIYIRLAKKFPAMKGHVREFSPMRLMDKDPLKKSGDRSEQIWTDKRQIM